MNKKVEKNLKATELHKLTKGIENAGILSQHKVLQ